MFKIVLSIVCSSLFVNFAKADESIVTPPSDERPNLTALFTELRRAAEDHDLDHRGFRAVIEGGGRIALEGHFKRSQTFGQFPVRITLRLDPDALAVEVTGLDAPAPDRSPHAHKSRYTRVDYAAYLARFTPGKLRSKTILDDLVRGVARGVKVDTAIDCVGSLVRAEF